MIRKGMRHTKRYQEILNAFIRNGFSHFLFRIGLMDRLSPEDKRNATIDMNLRDVGKKLRETLQRLGPTFIKLGQIASARRDIVPEEIANELEKLQDEVTSFSYEEVKGIVEFELGDTIENLFQEFNEKPLATASIGQVHVATLFTGEEVAIKIQRPDIEPIIETDLQILDNLARVLENRMEWARTYRIKDMIYEYSNSLRNELNYGMEGHNGERIAKQFENQDHIHVPKIHWEFSTNKVLTMEMIKGIKVNHIEELDAKGYNREVIAKRLTDAMFKQVLEKGFFHGDPHAGNIFILPDNVVTFLDFGMVGQLTDDLKYHFASLLINLKQGDSKGIVKTFSSMDILNVDTNMDALYRDLNQLQSRYYNISLNDISLGKIMIEIFSIAYQHKIEIPSDIAILAKVILTLEGIIEKLDPNFSIMKAVEPYGKKLFRQRYSPTNIIRNSLNGLVENMEILSSLPKSLKNITTTIQKGKLRLDINVIELKAFLHRLDKISNRLSFSIILLAFSILMAGLIIGASISGQTTMLWKLPIIEIGSVEVGS